MMFSIILVFSITKSHPPSFEKALLICSIVISAVMYLCYCFICDEKKSVMNMVNESIEYPATILGSKAKISKLEKEANTALVVMTAALALGAIVVFF